MADLKSQLGLMGFESANKYQNTKNHSNFFFFSFFLARKSYTESHMFTTSIMLTIMHQSMSMLILGGCFEVGVGETLTHFCCNKMHLSGCLIPSALLRSCLNE